jgi:hypothetical protein
LFPFQPRRIIAIIIVTGFFKQWRSTVALKWTKKLSVIALQDARTHSVDARRRYIALVASFLS